MILFALSVDSWTFPGGSRLAYLYLLGTSHSPVREVVLVMRVESDILPSNDRKFLKGSGRSTGFVYL